ncbi:MAG: methyl-accepting chemotaxis protein [Thermoplasmata archaeon]
MRLSLTVKLVASILVLVLLPIAGISMISLSGLEDIKSDVEVLYSENLEVVTKIAEGSGYLAGTDSNFLLYYINYGTTDAGEYLAEHSDQMRKFDQFLTDFDNNYSYESLPSMAEIIEDQQRSDLLDDQVEAFDTVESEWEDYVFEVQDVARHLVYNQTEEAAEVMVNASVTMQTLTLNMNRLIDIYTDGAALMDIAAEETIEQSTFWTLVGGVSAALAISIGALLVSLLVTSPIVTVSKAAERIAEGDFTTKLDIKAGRDEVGDLVRSMNSLIENTSVPLQKLTESSRAIADGDYSKDIDVDAKGDLARLVDSFRRMRNALIRLTEQVQITSKSLTESSTILAETAKHMTDATQQVSSSMTQTSKGAQIQAAKVDEMVRMLGEQTKAIYDVVQSSQNAARASEDASDVAQRGGRSAEDALQRIKSLLKSVEDTANAMNALTKKSKEISQIVMIISNIAQQTNLLSLNAAIEAARAGEHGRGFAVVADEVRKLAEGSRKAAGQIQSLIESVEKDIVESTTKMDQTKVNMSEGTRTVSEALKSLEDIAATVEETAAMVQEISASTQQQKALTESLARSLDEVASIATETSSSAEEVSASSEEVAAGMEELTASAQDLADLANTLNRITKDLSTMETAGKPVRTLAQRAGKPQDEDADRERD